MGQYYFIKLGFGEEPEIIDISSEDLDLYLKDTRRCTRLLNTTKGIWFYERDLWDKKKLKVQLRQLIKEIDKLA